MQLFNIKINLTYARLWDQSAIAGLARVILSFRRRGVRVDIVGLNEASATLVDRLSIYDKTDASEDVVSH